MALPDWGFSYQGLVLGQGTAYRVTKLDGIGSLPELRTSDFAKLRHHGAFSGIDVLEGRTVQLGIAVVGTSAADLDAQLAALEVATVPLLMGGFPLSYKLPVQVQRRVNARARKRAMSIDPTYTRNHALVAVEFFCGDPRIYDDTLTTTVIAAAGTITNAGSFESRPLITVIPTVSPVTITNSSDGGNQIVLATSALGPIPSPCVIDLLARTVVDGSGANRFDVVDPATTWTVLVPGANNLTIAGGSMSVDWRSAWI
jgi:hypothetical protein